MDIKEMVAKAAKVKFRNKGAGLLASLSFRPSKAMLISTAKEFLVSQAKQVEFPEGWDDVKLCMYLAFTHKDPIARAAAITYLGHIARCHRVGESMLQQSYNAIAEELQKYGDDFPQVKPLQDFHNRVSVEYNHKRDHVVGAVKTSMDKDLEELLG